MSMNVYMLYKHKNALYFTFFYLVFFALYTGKGNDAATLL